MTTLRPGLLLNINGEDVSIVARDAVEDAEVNGVTYQLTHPVNLGSVGDLTEFLGRYGAPVPDPNKYPDWLKSIYQRLQQLDLRVEELALEIAPTKRADRTPIPDAQRRNNTFDLGVSATWKVGNEQPIIGGLKVRGLYVQVNNDNATTPPAPSTTP